MSYHKSKDLIAISANTKLSNARTPGSFHVILDSRVVIAHLLAPRLEY
jgi:hypothetical protein